MGSQERSKCCVKESKKKEKEKKVVQVDQEDGGVVLEMIRLPAAMKLQSAQREVIEGGAELS